MVCVSVSLAEWFLSVVLMSRMPFKLSESLSFLWLGSVDRSHGANSVLEGGFGLGSVSEASDLDVGGYTVFSAAALAAALARIRGLGIITILSKALEVGETVVRKPTVGCSPSASWSSQQAAARRAWRNQRQLSRRS